MAVSKILVIEDETLFLRVLQIYLTKRGYDVAIASDGAEGIRKFDEGRFDLVITDLKMPGIDGNGVARHIRCSGRPDTPIIGISATPEFAEMGFNRILAKPFPLPELLDAMGRIEGRRLREGEEPAFTKRRTVNA